MRAMKRQTQIHASSAWALSGLLGLVLLVAGGCGPKPPPSVPAAGPAKPAVTNAVAATNGVAKNIFLGVFDDDPKSGGVDPFFPKSTRFSALAGAATNGTQAAAVAPAPPASSLLVLNGIFGSEMATISRTRIMLNEERPIKIGSETVTVKLLEIKETSVVVLVDGERKELGFPEPK